MELKEIVTDLKSVPNKDNWILWTMEDLIAERWHPIFCASSMGAIKEQYMQALKAKERKAEEMKLHIVAFYQDMKISVPPADTDTETVKDLFKIANEYKVALERLQARIDQNG